MEVTGAEDADLPTLLSGGSFLPKAEFPLSGPPDGGLLADEFVGTECAGEGFFGIWLAGVALATDGEALKEGSMRFLGSWSLGS